MAITGNPTPQISRPSSSSTPLPCQPPLRTCSSFHLQVCVCCWLTLSQVQLALATDVLFSWIAQSSLMPAIILINILGCATFLLLFICSWPALPYSAFCSPCGSRHGSSWALPICPARPAPSRCYASCSHSTRGCVRWRHGDGWRQLSSAVRAGG